MASIRSSRSACARSEAEAGGAGPEARAVIRAIRERRSVSPRRLMHPGPSAEEVRWIADALAAAPDHGLLRPARLIHIRESRREALAGVFEAALLERDPEVCIAARERARDKARNGAVLVALVARITPGHPDVPETEQWVAVGAALQNALLTMEALGYRGMIVSGPAMRARCMHEALGLSDAEHMVGFIAMGTAAKAPKERQSKDSADVLTDW